MNFENYIFSFFPHYRIGGREEFVKAAPDSLYRVDGAWFVCFDKHLFLENNCTVLSFGINTDPSFDVELVDKYKCRVESFDPFIEADIFATARIKSPDSLQAATLNVKPNWSFHKTGIAATDQDANSLYSPGGLGSLNQILEYTNLKNKVRVCLFSSFLWLLTTFDKRILKLKSRWPPIRLSTKSCLKKSTLN